MNIVRNIFYRVTIFLFLFTATIAKAQRQIEWPEITSVATNLPITFSWINFEDAAEDVPAVAQTKIRKIIADFYLESSGGDTANLSKAPEYYFNSLSVPLHNVTLFIVILKTPLSYAHCKLFVYDTASNTVSNKTVDYNIWAMYSIDDNSMKRSDLYKGLQLNNDDIILKKRSNLVLRRLKNNGTSNKLEEITYHLNGVSLDSVSFKPNIMD